MRIAVCTLVFAALTPAIFASASECVVTTSDGVRLAVKVAGQGPPILFLHGGPGQGSLSFERMGGSALESFATMIYLDQRGSGRSQRGADYALDRLIADIEEVRASLGYDRVYLLAHSFGGILAVKYAVRHPERVTGIIMAAATVHFHSNDLLAEQNAFIGTLLGRPQSASLPATRETLLAERSALRAELNGKGLGFRLIAEQPTTVPTMTEIDGSYAREMQFGSAVMQQRQDAASEYFRDYAPLTRSVDAPVLVVAATRDRAIGLRHFETFQFPDQRIAFVDGGHLFYYENSAAFLDTVRSFVRRSNAR